MFADGFPSYQLARGRTEAEVVGIIKACLEAGKDVYEMGFLDDADDGIEY